MYWPARTRPPFFMRFDRIEAPATEPVSLEDMRLQCRIDDDDTDQDPLIEAWITAAIEYAESYTQRSLVTQTWRGTADRFPSCGESQEIILRHGPVSEIAQITYVDQNGTLQTLDPALYIFDESGAMQRVAPAFGVQWPQTRDQLGAVKVDFVAGYGAAQDVPKSIVQWIKIRVGTLYEHRGEVEIVPRGKLEPMTFIDGMLDIYRVVAV